MGAGRLSQSDRNSSQGKAEPDRAGPGKSAGGQARRAGSRETPTATARAAAAKSEGADRPGASGHRFGPELACSECGIAWDVHQREPKPCKTEVPAEPDAFARRPPAPLATETTSDSTEPASTADARSLGDSKEDN